MNRILHLPRLAIVALISLYQKTLSPDHGWFRGFYPYGFCKFEPTCSEYMRRRVMEEGAIRGIIKGTWRILHCNPCFRGNRQPGK